MVQKDKPKIGIIGLGYVGKAVKYWFEKQKFSIFFYDKYKKIGSIEEINEADIIFVCVPTPYLPKQGYKDSAVVESLKNIKPGKIVVIKSTILPGSTEKFQKKFPNLKIIFNPEFLTEKNALNDFLFPDRQIIGYTLKSKNTAKRILNILPPADFSLITTAREAEIAKYMANSFFALKVVFANEFYDLCKKLKANYHVVKEIVGADKRIGKSHLEIFFDGYRGYGGSCLSKDVNSILQFAKRKKIKLNLLKVARETNQKLLKKNGFCEEYFLNFSHRKNEEK